MNVFHIDIAIIEVNNKTKCYFDFSPDIPAILADKIKNIVEDFYSKLR